MDYEPMKLNRVAYKGKYQTMRNLFVIALTLWVFTMAFLFATARANISMQQEMAVLESKGQLVIVK